MFTRVKSKRAKAARPEPIAERVQEEKQDENQIASKRSPKKPPEATAAELKDSRDVGPPRRRSTRNSGDKAIAEPAQLELPKRRSKRTSTETAQKTMDVAHGQGKKVVPERTVRAANRSRTPDQENAPPDTTKIALPFADTPIIRRNKEMRKGSNESRRSSLSNRGRRASSLIDSGTSNGLSISFKSVISLTTLALPHEQVEAADFYKHIESGLLEPRRMRQLLMWCGTRALGEKPSFATEDGPARLAGEAHLETFGDAGTDP